MRRGILITRPEPGLGETMRAVAAMGLEPIACPMLDIRARMPRLPAAGFLQAILLTSGQAVAPLAEATASDTGLRRLPLFSVGDATAARARAAGFTEVVSAAGDAVDLAVLVRARQPPGAALLLVTGEGQGALLAQSLRRSGYRLHRRVLYEAKPTVALSAAGLAALRSERLAACLFFSAGTARNFERRCPVSSHRSLGAVRALAISPAVGEALAGLPWQSVEITAHPDTGSMLSLLRRIVPTQPEPEDVHAGDSP